MSKSRRPPRPRRIGRKSVSCRPYSGTTAGYRGLFPARPAPDRTLRPDGEDGPRISLPARRALATLKIVSGEQSSHEVVERLFSHRPIRDGLERILQAREGALVVLGTNLELEAVSVDGLKFSSADLDGARLAEVAKMDGAIILDNDWSFILSANAHLAPPPNVPTTESGARHRTAQRVAQVTGLPVVTVSKDRAVVTLYIDAEQMDITPRWTIGERVAHQLQTLFDLRERFDRSDENLLRMEMLGLVTSREVASVLQLGEMVERSAAAIQALLADSDQDSTTTETLVADRVFEVERLMEMTLRDYLGDQAEAARDRLAQMPSHRLSHAWLLASELGLDRLEDGAPPRGNRLLHQAGFPTEHLRRLLLDAFPDARAMLRSSVDDFMDAKGIGIKNATRLRFVFDRLLAAVHPIGQRTLTNRD